MEKYQLDNPNNCRIKISYNDKNPPVTFEYVGDDSAFKVCYKFFRHQFSQWFMLSFAFFAGIIAMKMGYIGSGKPANLIFMVYLILMFLLMFYFYPALIGLLFSKNRKLLKLMPYLWSIGKVKFYAEFKPEDVKENKVEIPLYSNVFLGYSLEGDFSDQIETIEVIEHPFSKIVTKGRKRKELKRNEYLWKATFYFKQQPKDGILKVQFH